MKTKQKAKRRKMCARCGHIHRGQYVCGTPFPRALIDPFICPCDEKGVRVMAVRNGDIYRLPADVARRAAEETRGGVKIRITPKELVRQIRLADEALNGDSNDAEHDSLYALREWLSDLIEDPDRRMR